MGKKAGRNEGDRTTLEGERGCQLRGDEKGEVRSREEDGEVERKRQKIVK